MKLYFYGNVINNKLILDNREHFDQIVSSHNGKKVTLTLEEYKKRRSKSQNNYYWGVIVEILRHEFGYSADEMHDALRLKFLKVRGKIETIRSTTTLTTKEAEEYYSQIRIWASSEMNVNLPEPNEIDYKVDNFTCI